MIRSDESGAFTLLDALVQERIEEAGGNDSYAEKLGISSSTLWRWRVGEVDLFSTYSTREKRRFINDLGFPVPALQRLADITLNEACVRILEVEERQDV